MRIGVGMRVGVRRGSEQDNNYIIGVVRENEREGGERGGRGRLIRMDSVCGMWLNIIVSKDAIIFV